ncbi:MAG: Uma2 family endonuclease [Pseudomonadota bacterium]
MNIHAPSQTEARSTTRAAEGLGRRRFTTAELEAMAAAGILADHERIELIAGEVVPMSPKGNRHEILRTRLAKDLTLRLGQTLTVSSEPQFNVNDDTHYVPDILVHDAETDAPFVTGPNALLVIEIAESSLAFDLDRKATLYSIAGVREYWVIDVATLVIHAHLQPRNGTYAEFKTFSQSETVTARHAPALKLCLDDMALPWTRDEKEN